MKFYYCNSVGDNGYFEEDNLVKAIYTAWNIEADLYLLVDGKKQIVFAPWESNEFNSDILEEFGFYMVDGEKFREIKDLKTNETIKYEWAEIEHVNLNK